MTVNPAHRRLITLIMAFTIFLVLVLLGLFARVPYVGLTGGPTVNTLGEYKGQQVVTVTGPGITQQETAGHLNLTTVSVVDQITLFEALGLWGSGSYALAPREVYYPPTKSVEDVRSEQANLMMNSEENATAAALGYLRMPTAVAVSSVADGSPADGIIADGDRIRAVNGTAVGNRQQLIDAIGALNPGDTASLALARVVDGRPVEETVEVVLGTRPDSGGSDSGDGAERGYLGIGGQLASADPELDITFHVGEIGGPSAGLMLTLAVIDRISDGDLTHGKFIAGTGTIDPDGKVGAIGGITHKMRAARDAGAEYFFVPGENCGEAAGDTPSGLTLMKADTLADATAALDQLGEGKTPAGC